MFDNFLKRSDVHPYLAAVFVSIQAFRLYGNGFLIPILGQLVGILLILGMVVWLFQKFVWKGSLGASASLSILFSFCFLYFLLWSPAVNTLRMMFGLLRERYLFLISCLLILCLTYLFYKIRRRKLTMATLYINLLLLSLSSLEAYHMVTGTPTLPLVVGSNEVNQKRSGKPDIYFILLDGYTNPETTPRYFGFENRGLVDSLRKKGFYVVKNSKSNYKFTYQTVGSALNMSFLSKPFPESFLTFKSISDNLFIRTAKASGYRAHNLSIFNMKGQPSPFHLESYAPGSFEFYDFVFSRTLLATFSKKAKNIPMNDIKIHENSIAGFRSLDRLVSDTTHAPKFVYLHSLISHGPFWMDSSGTYSEEVVSRNAQFASKDMAAWHNGTFKDTDLGDSSVEDGIIKDYRTHLAIANNVTLKSVENILDKKPNSIIIVMSDHGFRYLMRHSAEDTQAEQYANLCAIYFPDGNYESLNDHMTPINVFRAVSNEAFGSAMEYVLDRSVF
jgi:hypothetical protein